jgi:putative aldouronate transport system substrate-binding protein
MFQRRNQMARKMNRRTFLRTTSAGGGVLIMAACGTAPAAQVEPTQAPPAAEPTAAPAAEPTAAPAAESTQVPQAEATLAPTTAAEAATTAAEPASAGAGMPVVTEPLTLTYWADLGGNAGATMQSFNEMVCYQELEKLSGIHLEFQHPPLEAQLATEQFNLMIASGKFPDVIESNFLAFPGGPAKAIRDNVIIRLNELIDEHAPNIKKVLADHPEWRKQIITDEGDIYCFPFLRGDPLLMTFTGATVRKDYFDKEGIEIPTTIDEWHTALTALKGKDLNGNGNQDEWPFSSWVGNVRGGFNTHTFIGAWGITTGFYQDNGVVKYGPLQPEYKEFLQTMVNWHSEGLMDPDAVAMDQKAFDAKMTNGQIAAAVMNTGSGIGRFTGLMADKPETGFKLAGAPYPTLKAGDKPSLGQQDNPYPGGGSAAISSTNQHVVETVKLLDYAFGPEGHMLFNFGVEGVSYNLVDGYPKYTDDIMKNPDGLPLAQSMARHHRANFSGPFVQDVRYFEQYVALPEQQEAVKIWSEPTNEKMMPPVTPTQDESRRFARIMGEVNTRYDEIFSKVLTGAEPMTTWDTFVQELQQLGIEEAVAVQQAALDRFNKRA